jgi:hypothetical protein
VRGEPALLGDWRDSLTGYAPRRLAFFVPADVAGLPAALAAKSPRDTPVAYVCRGMTCTAPIASLDVLGKLLEPTATGP